MNAVLVVGYLGYVLLLMATLKRLGHLKQERVGLGDVLWFLAIFTMSIYSPVSFCGQGLGFVYVGFISYLFLRQFIKEDERLNRTTVLLLMALLGLLVTRLSTAVIVVAYLFITTAILLIVEPRQGSRYQGCPQKLIAPMAPLLLAFIVYEVYVDVSLFNALVKVAIHILSSLYAEEVVIAGKAMEVRGLSITDLFLYLISTRTKVVLILAIALVHTIALVCKRKALNDDERRLALLLVTSYPTWAIGWVGVGSLISSIRAIAVTSFLLSLSIATTYKKLCNFVTKKKFLLMIPIVLIVLGFSSNFGLPFEPTIKSDGEAYTYPTSSQCGFGDYALYPIVYASLHARDTPFLCLQPYTAFGLCDLMWNSPRHGFEAPEVTTPEFIIKMMKSYLGKGVIIPQPMRDRLLPGPIGYHSLYKRPLCFLLENGGALVYSNGMYALFLA